MADERRSRDAIAGGELVPVLQESSAHFPGFYLYYPQRRYASPTLRVFVDYLLSARKASRAWRGRATSPVKSALDVECTVSPLFARCTGVVWSR